MKRVSFSRAETIAIFIALGMLALQALGAADFLDYRFAALKSEPWRVLTGHFVHVNWQHAAINAVALWVVARLFALDLNATRQLTVLLIAALAISAGLAWLLPSIVWYRGLSGALHGLFFAGATVWLVNTRLFALSDVWLPSALFFGGWIKVALEQPGGDATPYAEWLGTGVVPQAHLIGAASGTLLGLAFALRDSHVACKQQRGQQ
ncbi:MAG: rhombosortase [Burkholderiaceae bacterium]